MRRQLLRSGVFPLRVPLPPDHGKGWKSYPLFKGRTRNRISLSCHVSVLTQGNCPHPPHVHDDEELLLLLAGEADLVLPEGNDLGKDHRLRLTAGQFVYYPAGFPHTLEAVGEEPANYMMFKWSSNVNRGAAQLSFGRFEFEQPPKKARSRNGFHSKLLFQNRTDHLDKLHCHATVLTPGGGYDEHVDAHDVAIVMLEGEVETLGQRSVPDNVMFYAAGEPHGMYNPGGTEAHYLVFEFHGGYKPPLWRRKVILGRR